MAITEYFFGGGDQGAAGKTKSVKQLASLASIGELTSTECARNIMNSEWTMVIRPKTGWLDLHLAELWRYRDLIQLFVWRDFVSAYKQTVLGPLWYLIQPLLTTVAFTVIFGRVARISTDGLPAVLFYLAGVTTWNYFAECLQRTSGTFIANASIFGKVYFPRLCVPLSIVVSSLVKFSIQYLLFLAFVAFYWAGGAPVHPTRWLLLTPALLALCAALSLGLGITVSALTTKYRDLQHLIGFGTQLLMFATPVVYPLSAVPAQYHWLVLANPVTPLVEAFRLAHLGVGSVQAAHLLYSAMATVTILLTGVILFNRVEKDFMDTV